MFEISEAEILARLQFDNPWWDSNDSSGYQYSNMPRRKYFAPFVNAVTDRSVRRAVVLMGPRRVGKTVMVYHTIAELLERGTAGRHILYLSLETPLYTGLALEKILKLFTSMFDLPATQALFIFFDEVQYLRHWEIHLKSLVDSYPHFKFVATGSAAAALRMKSNESGAGRFTNFLLPPLTFAEYLHFKNLESTLITRVGDKAEEHGPDFHSSPDIEKLNQEFVNYLNYGGYPEAVFSQTVQNDTGQYIKSDIIDKVLLRDLPSLYGISDIQELNRLFTVLSYNSGNEVSLEALSKTAGVAKNTIKKYLEYLEAAFLIQRVERIDQTAKRFERASHFKIYLTNPSMRAALFGPIASDSPAMGNLVETAIFSHWKHQDSINLYYARWSTGEIDIVHLAARDQSPRWAVEVKWSDRPTKDHSQLAHCAEFAQRNRHLSQPLICTTLSITGEAHYRDVEFRFIPSSLYAYTLGANILGKTVFGAPT